MISPQTDTRQADAPSESWRAISHPIGTGQRRLRLIRPGDPITNGHKPNPNEVDCGPFPLAWRDYYRAEFAPIHLPAGKKKPPPAGYTGHNGKRATITQSMEWADCYQNANIGHWFGGEILRDGVWYQEVGIDVDQYEDKHGGDQLKALENVLGAQLPPTWISGARTDGVSGTRWFLAPVGIRFNDRADTDIDILQRHHRYAMVWPSVHPNGETCWWFPPGVAPDDGGRAAWSIAAGLPVLHDLPVLPPVWVAYLASGNDTNDIEMDWNLSVTELEQWAEDEFNSGLEADLCWNIASAVKTWKKRIDEDSSSHDKIRDSYWMTAKLAFEGHTGWKDSKEAVGSYWYDDVLRRNKRSDSEARAEIFGAWISSLRKVKTLVESGAMVPAGCPCAGKGANLWHSEQAPMKAARQFALLHERAETHIRRWRADWYQYNGTCYDLFDEDSFDDLFYNVLEDAMRLKAVVAGGVTTFEPVPWNPNDRKIFFVKKALRPVVRIDTKNDAPCWLDGRNDEVIAFQNSLLRIAGRQQIECTPEYFNTNVLPFDYDPAVGVPVKWLEFLSQLWPDDPESIALLQEWFGYIVSGRNDLEKILALFGLPRTGKGTIAHVLRSLAGAYNCCGPSADSLCERFGLEPLIGKTLAIMDELAASNGKKFVSVIKDISGRGAPTVDRKNKLAWNGNLGVRFMLLANQRENLPDASGAIIDRMVVLETTISFKGKEDEGLREKLEAELPAILNWALDGLDRLNNNDGHFTVPKSTLGLIDEMHAASAPITEFFGDKEVFRFNSRGFVSRATAFHMWSEWCGMNKLSSGSMNSFLAKIRAAYGRQINADKNTKRLIKGKQERVLLGVHLTPQTARELRARQYNMIVETGLEGMEGMEPVKPLRSVKGTGGDDGA
jgi:putative DNA primase/helicase